MLLPRKWALSLGLLAAVPSISVAGPFDAPKAGGEQQTSPAEASQKQQNQKVAEEIARALGRANLTHQDVSIEYKSGVATIGGQIKDEAQRAVVTRVVSRVAGVNQVENNLTIMDASTAKSAGVQQAAAQQAGGPDRRVQQVNYDQRPARSNQEVAQNIATALSSTGLNRYDIEVRYKNGIASLIGNVDDPSQAMMAQQAAYSVDGVGQVINELRVKGQPAPQMPPGPPMPGMPMHPGAIQQAQGMAPQGMPMGYGPGSVPPQGAYAPVQAYPGGPAQVGHQVYNQPNMPNHAWPAYAQYDNYAQVTYPSQYDASAWPYIGPYYPYPQVPLGWRSSTLEWKDGSWNLSFDSRTDRWWWFMSPKNW